MRRSTLGILACPMCKAYPLKLFAFAQEMQDGETIISEGVLRCSKCNRWYPIIDSIPRMLPDSMRPDYRKFISKYSIRMRSEKI